jgi:hypothetical protein
MFWISENSFSGLDRDCFAAAQIVIYLSVGKTSSIKIAGCADYQVPWSMICKAFKNIRTSRAAALYRRVRPLFEPSISPMDSFEEL